MERKAIASEVSLGAVDRNGFSFVAKRSLFFYNPNVSELKRVAVALQLHWSGSSFRFATGSAGFSRYLEIVVNDDPIQANRDFGVFDLLPVLRFGVGEVDVVGLPTERRKAGIHVRVLDRINATAFIVRSLQSKGVKNLHLEVVDLVKSAVSPTLPAGCRTVGKQELKVHVVVVEFSPRANVGSIGVQ